MTYKEAIEPEGDASAEVESVSGGMWSVEKDGKKVDPKKLIQVLKADTKNGARFAVAVIVLIRLVGAGLVARTRSGIFTVPPPFESRMVAHARSSPALQRGVLEALESAGMVSQSGRGAGAVWRANEAKAREALDSVFCGDGSALKRALWPGEYPDADGRDGTPDEPDEPTEQEAYGGVVTAPGLRLIMDSLKEIATALSGLNDRYGIIRDSMMTMRESAKLMLESEGRILEWAKSVPSTIDTQKAAFDALRTEMRSSRDAQLAAVRETHQLIEMMEQSLSKAADAVPIALLVEQLKAERERMRQSSNQLNNLAVEEERLMQKADQLLTRHGGSGG
jgi:hypothetical protein